MTNFYISDLHIGHENILRFENRPFADINEMNNKIIENWNSRVCNGDTVYILGDFIWAKEAQVKIYLTASSMVRAKRRYDELTAKGESCNLEKIRQDIEDRDYRDMHRETSPLKQAEDAVLVDTSDMTIEQVIDRIVALIG